MLNSYYIYSYCEGVQAYNDSWLWKKLWNKSWKKHFLVSSGFGGRWKSLFCMLGLYCVDDSINARWTHRNVLQWLKLWVAPHWEESFVLYTDICSFTYVRFLDVFSADDTDDTVLTYSIIIDVFYAEKHRLVNQIRKQNSGSSYMLPCCWCRLAMHIYRCWYCVAYPQLISTGWTAVYYFSLVVRNWVTGALTFIL